jgi:hypothetical protein
MNIKTLIIPLYLIFLAESVHSQIDIRSYTSATDTFYWKKYEHIRKPVRLKPGKFAKPAKGKPVEQFMSAFSADYPQFTSDSMRHPEYGDWKKYLFYVDINGDGENDILYSGPTGGESDIVRIYLCKPGGFELIFEDFQYITMWTLKNKRLTAIQTGDIGCCDEYLWFTRNYQVNWENTNPDVIRGKQTVWYRYTELPLRFLDEPVPFQAAADTLLLRASAARLNEPFNPVLETFGNIIAKYRTKCRGTILAKKLTGKTDEWYFVEIFPDVMPSASILYNTDKLPTFVRGWISGLSISVK